MTPSQATLERIPSADSTVLKPFLTTEEAAHYLGLKRQGFLVLKKFIGLQPCKQIRLKSKSKNNLYASQDIQRLLDFKQRYQVDGLGAVL
jgi:hypothetical protein